MQIISSPLELHEHITAYKNDGLRVGFVPTMGALHEGHLSLVDLAKENADKVVVSIFVNPTQFAPGEDFDSYPRSIESDSALLEERGVDLIYLPTTEAMYPDGVMDSAIKAGAPAAGLETINILGGDIVRDEHGLALSSRNAYLSREELAVARQLNVILRDASILDKPQAILEAGFDKVDYVALKPEWSRILAAAWIGKTRLIDNMAV